MTIGERIAQLRKRSGLSQEKLAALIGVSRQAIGKWESGLSLPGIDNLQELANALQISCDELITGNPPVRQTGAETEQLAISSIRELFEQQENIRRRTSRRRFWISFFPALFACLFAAGSLAAGCSAFLRADALEEKISGLAASVSGLQSLVHSSGEAAGQENRLSLTAGYDHSYILLPDKDAVLLQVSALPKNIAAGQSAQFALITKDKNLTQPADMQGSEFRTEFEIPLTNEYDSFKISFILASPDGATEQEILFSETAFITQYTLRLILEPDTFEAIAQPDGSLYIGGQMALTVERCEARYPISGKLELIIDGKTIASEQIDPQVFDGFTGEDSDDPDLSTERASAFLGFTTYTNFPTRKYEASASGEVAVRARITDNLGKEHTIQWSPD